MNSEKWIESLYAANAKRVYRIAAYLLKQSLGHSADASDVVQEVFLLAARNDIRSHPKPEGWLVETTKNVCSNFIRTARRANRKQDKAGNAYAKKSVHCVHSYAEPSQDHTGESDVLLTLKQALTPEEYELLRAYCIEMEPVEAIAVRTGMKPNAIRVKIWRIREKTKNIFYDE